MSWTTDRLDKAHDEIVAALTDEKLRRSPQGLMLRDDVLPALDKIRAAVHLAEIDERRREL